MLVLLAGYFGDPADPRLIPGSVAIELVHLATLYHDDVIDEADARHGAPSANVRWDNTVAILTGDYLFARASEISTELGTDVCRLLARTIAILCDGQIREVDSSAKVEQPEGAYLEIIRRKTAALIATSCRLGGMLSDATPEHIDVLEEFGEALGMAFQLSDDIMDITATQLELGQGARLGPAGGRLHRCPSCTPWPTTSTATSSRGSSGTALPRASCLDRALEIVRGRVDRPRPRGRRRRGRPGDRAWLTGCPAGPAQHALVQLARFLAVRCGAEQTP